MTLFKEKKILALDLDGTLLDDDKLISPSTLKGLEEAINNNVTIAIATGRVLADTVSVLARYDFDCYLICSNGALIKERYADHLFYRKVLERDEAYEIIEYALREKEAMYICGEDYWGITRANQMIMDFMAKQNLNLDIIRDTRQLEGLEIISLTSVGNTEKIKKYIINEGLKVNYTDSVVSIMDIIPQGISKGRALMVLAEKINCPPENIIAVGNYYNDIEMIKMAKIGIAMQNSPPQVKEIADYVTERTNNEDGVLEVLERFVL